KNVGKGKRPISLISRLPFLLPLAWLRCHQVIQLRVSRELVDKRNKRTSDLQESVPGIYVCHVRKLQIRDIQQLRKLLAICARLIQHDDKFTVRQHSTSRM